MSPSEITEVKRLRKLVALQETLGLALQAREADMQPRMALANGVLWFTF